MKTILFTISNAAGTVYKFKTFRKNGYRVIGCDANPDAVGQFFCDAFHLVPLQKSPDYHEALLDIVENEGVDILIAGQGESPGLIAIEEKFSNLGCTLVATDLNTLDYSLDKVKLFTYLRDEMDLPLPEFYAVETLADFDAGMQTISNPKKCVKPAVASGSRGFVIFNDEAPKADIFFKKKAGFTEMTTEAFRTMLAESDSFPKLILMEYMEDMNYDTTLICKEGKILWQSIRTRAEAKVGTITKGEIVEIPELYEINTTIAKSLGTTGYISTQFIGNKLIEINPRWSTSLIYRSINEYMMGVKLFTGEDLNIDPVDVKNYAGVKMLRYWDVLTYKDGAGSVE